MSPKTLTTEESKQFISYLHQWTGNIPKPAIAARNTCLGLLMLDAGLRVGEAMGLKRKHLVALKNPVKQIIVPAAITKTKTERMIPTTQLLRDSIMEVQCYCWYHEPEDYEQFAFALDSTNRPVTVRQVERIFTKYGNLAIGRPVKPHTLRHTFASKLMRVTNARIVQQLLGHKSLTSTQIYTHPNGDDLEKAISQI